MKGFMSHAIELVTPELFARISDRTAKIGIVGMGYVGLPLALLFSEQGFHVTGFDVD
jgi:UDP-N-acetyl-D-glucosamine dehydrogenase